MEDVPRSKAVGDTDGLVQAVKHHETDEIDIELADHRKPSDIIRLWYYLEINKYLDRGPSIYLLMNVYYFQITDIEKL